MSHNTPERHLPTGFLGAKLSVNGVGADWLTTDSLEKLLSGPEKAGGYMSTTSHDFIHSRNKLSHR
jgi:hypothetical protein